MTDNPPAVAGDSAIAGALHAEEQWRRASDSKGTL